MAVDETRQAERRKALGLAISQIEKQFGKGSIMRLGNDEKMVADVESIPTGSLGLDVALGVGGLARGRGGGPPAVEEHDPSDGQGATGQEAQLERLLEEHHTGGEAGGRVDRTHDIVRPGWNRARSG